MSGEEGAGAGAATGGGALARNRVSAEQLDILLSFMEEHAEFAAGKASVYSRFSASKLWRLLAERLNAAALDSGGARKSPDKWCRYWADIKYKARKKTAAGGALGELSSVEERLRALITSCGAGGGAGEEDRKPAVAGGAGGLGGPGGADEDALSSASGGGLNTEELLAEAAMRTALAAEKQAEAVAQGVELLRELVGLVRERLPAGAGAGPGGAQGALGALGGAAQGALGGALPPHHDPMQPMHHHHRL